MLIKEALSTGLSGYYFLKREIFCLNSALKRHFRATVYTYREVFGKRRNLSLSGDCFFHKRIWAYMYIKRVRIVFAPVHIKMKSITLRLVSVFTKYVTSTY